MDIHSLRVTGSLEVTGSLFVNGTNISSGGGASFPYTGSAIISGSLILIGSSSFSGSITSGVPADNIDYSPNSFTPFSRVTPITYTNYGVASLATMVATGSYDDVNYGILLPFTMSFFNRPYTQVFVGTNSYLTFGAGSTAFSSLGPANPAIPGIHIGASDNAMSRLLTGSEAGNTFRIKFEGNDRSTGQTLMYSWVFTSGSNTIQLHADTITPRAGAVTGVTTGSVNTTTYANVDYFDFPPSTTTSSVAYSITTSSGSYFVDPIKPSFSNAEGFQTVAFGLGSHSEGFKTRSTGIYSHAEGSASLASSSFSHAEGVITRASGLGSHAEGTGSLASGSFSHAEGLLTRANGMSSHAEGMSTIASGIAAHAEGQSTNATGNQSHAEGYFTIATGTYSHAEGNGNTASSEAAHAEGTGTVASGFASHAEGWFNNAIGTSAHAEGFITRAHGIYSHAEGLYAVASGSHSHAEGSGSISFGTGSHAEGTSTVAFGTGSHAEGSGSIASGSHQHASGRFNQHGNLTSLVVVGNGTSDASRSDIFRINLSNVEVTGSLNVTAGITGSLLGNASSATTSSFADNFTVAGALTAQTLVVQTITSSIEFVTGSTRNGSILSNTHQFTGSVGITGSLQVNGITAVVGSGTTNELVYWVSTNSVGALSVTTYPSLTEISYVKGVTSAIQTQINSKQGAITLTTTGTSGVATFSANTLNIPNYGSALSGYLPLSGGTLTGALSGTSATFSGNVGIGTTTVTTARLEVVGAIPSFFTADSQANSPTYGGSIFYRNHKGANQGNGITFCLNNASDTLSEYAYIGGLIESDTAGFHNGAIIFSPVSGGNRAERMRITSAGNVGIGTSSPFSTNGVNLEISSSSAFPSRLILTNTLGKQYFLQNQADGNLIIYDNTSAAERMRITSAGNVGIGTSSPDNKLQIGSTGSTGYGGNDFAIGNGTNVHVISVTNTNLNIYSTKPYTYLVSNVLIGTSTDNGERLYVNGAIRATGTITANSDARLKKNIERIENALEKVEQINGYTYEFKEDDSKRHAGVIAQEIQTVLPEIVNKGNDGILGVEYGNISALLIEAIKELSAENNTLKEILQRNNIQ